MRARRRRSVFNTISAAMLEVSIMGLFVILAQPQLRDALFELMQPHSHAQAHAAAQNETRAPQVENRAPPDETTATLTENSSATLYQARYHEAGYHEASNSEVGGVKYLDRSLAQVASLPLPPAGGQMSYYAPLEHYASFRVPVPDTTLMPNAPQSTASGLSGVTQLAPNQWNIGSGASYNQPGMSQHWAPLHSAQTSYHDIYPPPYGTQSPWR